MGWVGYKAQSEVAGRGGLHGLIVAEQRNIVGLIDRWAGLDC